MKVHATIQAYDDEDSDLVRLLESIVSKMPREVEKILEQSRGHYCTAEMVLYNVLIQDNVESIIAAQAAVLYPDPNHFHPNKKVFPYRDAEKRYESERKKGTDPLGALVKSAEISKEGEEGRNGVTHTISKAEYGRRYEVFARFVQEQREPEDSRKNDLLVPIDREWESLVRKI